MMFILRFLFHGNFLGKKCNVHCFSAKIDNYIVQIKVLVGQKEWLTSMYEFILYY